jgi:hypothetical protein
MHSQSQCQLNFEFRKSYYSLIPYDHLMGSKGVVKAAITKELLRNSLNCRKGGRGLDIRVPVPHLNFIIYPYGSGELN